MIVLIILLVSGHFLISIAWIREKESMKMISAVDFPAHGPWIVSIGNVNYKIYFRKKKITDMVILLLIIIHKIADYGTNEEFIERAREKFLTIQTNNASKVSSCCFEFFKK